VKHYLIPEVTSRVGSVGVDSGEWLVALKRGQQWALGGAVVLGVLLLISHPNPSTGGGARVSDSLSSCTVRVTVDLLDVRSDPSYTASVVDTFRIGAVVPADRTIRNGFRQLGPSRWAAREYLAPTAGTDCG
jgi:hypothetical protein